MPAEPRVAVPLTTETHYGIEGYADLPLVVLALLIACWMVFKGNRSVWLLACSLALFAIKHSLVYAFVFDPPLAQRLFLWHGYVGTAGWLFLTLYCAVLVFTKPQRDNKSAIATS